MPKRNRDQGFHETLRRALENQAAPGPPQHAQQDDDEEGLEALPSDLMTSILYLRSQMLLLHPSMPPVALRSQLRAMVGDSSELEREIDQLRRDNTIRMLSICSGGR